MAYLHCEDFGGPIRPACFERFNVSKKDVDFKMQKKTNPTYLNFSVECARRGFIATGLATLLGSASSASAANRSSLVGSTEVITLRRGGEGSGPTWFHPRCCVVPTGPANAPLVLMTLQAIAGSDYFGPVHWMTTQDLGATWSEPEPVPSLGRVKRDDGWDEGVCDVVPEFHGPTATVLAMGHSVCYRGPRFERAQPPRWPIYSVWNNGKWGKRRRLEWDDPRGALIYTNNCGQRVILPDGDIVFVMTFGTRSTGRSAAGVRCSYDGRTLAIKQVGLEMRHAAGRGLLEPSLVRWREKFYVTLRAEDDRGYVATSDDGLDFSDKQPWAWDNGEPLAMSTTQQHWMAHSEGLFLVYTRKDTSNLNVPRWRSPLFMAQVDPSSLRLLRDTEQILLPLVGDGVNAPDEVPYSGNFHPVNVSPNESWVTDGQMVPKRNYRGDLLLCRIRWAKSNRLKLT